METIYFKAYTDGACGNNGDWVGGYAFTLYYDEDDQDANEPLVCKGGSSKNTTNNIMEMKAFLAALEHFCKMCKMCPEQQFYLTIYTDSAYIHNCLSQKWYVKWMQNGWVNSKKEPVKNKELWEEILKYILNYSNISIRKVKGHSTNSFNNYVDKIAVCYKEHARNS